MNPSVVPVAIEPLGGTRYVNIQRKGIQISNLTIERPGIVEYLKNMTSEKLEIALIHALEVGVVEIEARRRRRVEPKS
jgi:hypothetical protein